MTKRRAVKNRWNPCIRFASLDGGKSQNEKNDGVSEERLVIEETQLD
jgi:hypothetical protein